MHYKVYWVIDVEADSTEDAAIQAQEIQRDPESTATFFHVRNVTQGDNYRIELPSPLDSVVTVDPWDGKL